MKNKCIEHWPSVRGTLIHHYRINFKGDYIEEGALNRIEALVRAFDPCLSCSTHAIGDKRFSIELYSADGQVLQQLY